MMNQLKPKRGRSRNFSEREKRIFEEIINAGRFMIIFENKRTDAASNKEKSAAWEEMTNIFNMKSGEEVRTPLQLRSFYDNLKAKKRRKTNTDDSGSNELTEMEEQIFVELIHPHLDVLNNDKVEFYNIKKVIWSMITNEFNLKVLRKKDAECLENYYKYFRQKQETREESNSNTSDPILLFKSEPVDSPSLQPEDYLHNIKHLPIESPPQQNSMDDTMFSDNSENPPLVIDTDASLSNNPPKKTECSVLNNKVWELEVEIKNKELEIRMMEYEEKKNIFILDRKIKEQELKMKEIETNIKLEEWKKIVNEKYNSHI